MKQKLEQFKEKTRQRLEDNIVHLRATNGIDEIIAVRNDTKSIKSRGKNV